MEMEKMDTVTVGMLLQIIIEIKEIIKNKIKRKKRVENCRRYNTGRRRRKKKKTKTKEEEYI